MDLQRAIPLEVTEGWSDYQLLDFGEGRKLERFGRFLVDRPEEQAMGKKALPREIWIKADAVFDGKNEDGAGRWQFKGKAKENFDLSYDGLKFFGRFTSFRHMGFFPEQAPHWRWMAENLASHKTPFRLLNLFGYTGLASLLAARMGADVTHVDASKKAILFARENQECAACARPQ